MTDSQSIPPILERLILSYRSVVLWYSYFYRELNYFESAKIFVCRN